MAYEMKEGQVSIFKNKHKDKEAHPDYRGEVMIDGELKDIALWVKEGKSGMKYFSGQISEKYKKEDKPKGLGESRPPEEVAAESDDLPF